MRSLTVALTLLIATAAIAGADQVLEDFSGATLGPPPPGWESKWNR